VLHRAIFAYVWIVAVILGLASIYSKQSALEIASLAALGGFVAMIILLAPSRRRPDPPPPRWRRP